MKIVVTGGAGFLGLHLSRSLIESGHSVTCVDNFYSSSPKGAERLAEANPTRFRVVRGDVGSQHVWSHLDPHDAVYHLACPASPLHYQRDPHFTLATAFNGTDNALHAALAWGCPILVASTSEVYGDPQVSPQPEWYRGSVSTVGPRSCYDEGKRAAESLSWAAHRSKSVDVRIVRIFNTYGPGMSPGDGRMVPNFIVQALAGAPLTVYGHGFQTRSLCYVDDTISGMTAVMDGDRPSSMPVYNIGNPDERTVVSIANDVIRLSGSSSSVTYEPPAADDPMVRRPDVSLAARQLGWKPRVDFVEGIRKTVDWFRRELA